MAGFAGIFRANRSAQRGVSELESMVRTLVHKPHHVFDRITNSALGFGIGWVQEDKCDGAVQAWNTHRDICLILAGENFPTRRNGEPSSGSEKAARQIRAYEDRGSRFIEDLNGWFSGVLMDFRQDRVILFNDRFGLSRVYYHESGDGLFFASEAKALLKVFPSLREIDHQGLAEFVSVGCVLQNRSLFKNVLLLPGGSAWVLNRGGVIDKRQYFDFATWEEQERLSPAAYTERLTSVFSRIAPHYLRKDQPVGISLTGGLDSRMILAHAQAAPGSLPCYTFGGPYRDSADVRIARQLAITCRQPHVTIPIKGDFFEEFPALAERTVYVSDGAMDVSGAVELYVNQHARQIAPVRVTGNYGSEILRSNVAFGPGPVDHSIFTSEFCSLLQGASETYRKEATGNRLSFIVSKQVPWHHYARLSIEKSEVTPRSPFLDNELVALAYRAPRELVSSPAPLLHLIAMGDSALDSVYTDRALRRDTVPILSKLARAWNELTAKAEYAYDYGMPRWLARIDRFLGWIHPERVFLGHHKFYHFRIWYRNQLSGYLQRSIDSSIDYPCYRPGAVWKMVNDHVNGRCNHTLALHRMLTVQLIEQLFIRK
jgi:asparagine synthase (glutamine-hydrolysing)